MLMLLCECKEFLVAIRITDFRIILQNENKTNKEDILEMMKKPY
jgi:hypothetical protein